MTVPPTLYARHAHDSGLLSRPLKGRLTLRARSNARYSLRAFARDLKLSPSKLSEILNGVRELSERTAPSVAERLKLSDDERALFLLSVKACNGRKPAERADARQALALRKTEIEASSLSFEAFRMVADWYHHALLELGAIAEFRFTARNAARRLGLPPATVAEALKRLEALGLVEASSDGDFRVTEAHTVHSSGVPSEAIRLHHSQILNLAIGAIHEQSIDRRNLRSLTLAIETERYSEAVEDILIFFKAFKQKYQTERGQEVYCLSSQFFSLEKRANPKESK